jgi:hypothetical protein
MVLAYALRLNGQETFDQALKLGNTKRDFEVNILPYTDIIRLNEDGIRLSRTGPGKKRALLFLMPVSFFSQAAQISQMG